MVSGTAWLLNKLSFAAAFDEACFNSISYDGVKRLPGVTPRHRKRSLRKFMCPVAEIGFGQDPMDRVQVEKNIKKALADMTRLRIFEAPSPRPGT